VRSTRTSRRSGNSSPGRSTPAPSDPGSSTTPSGRAPNSYKAPPPGQANLPPSAGLQFFGQVDIDGSSAAMTVRLKDLAGTTLYTRELAPA
jgi:alkaline phosphatase D